MKKVLVAVAVAFTVSSCGQQASTDAATTNTEQVQGVKQARVQQDEFKAFIKEHPEAQIVDVRTPGEFNGGHIDGAVNIDFYSKTFVADINKLDKTKPVLIYCKSGGRSGKALSQMKSMEFGTLLELSGGYSHWK